MGEFCGVCDHNETVHASRTHTNTVYCATIVAALGDSDGAVRLLWQAFDEGRNYVVWMLWGDWFAPLRNHPGFPEFMRPKG